MPSGFMYPGGSGYGKAKMVITVSLRDGASPAGVTVTITEIGTEKKFAEFTYGSQPITLDLPAHFQYRVTASTKWHYTTPEPVEGVAEAKAVIPVVMTYKSITRYGFRRTKAEADPAARIEYTFDAAGKKPMTVDLTNGTPNYGDWGDFINEVATPVMLKYDGTEDYELNRDDQTKKADGSPSDISDTGYQGNAMVRFGGKWKWVQRYEDDEFEYVTFSDGRYSEDYHAYAHTDANGVVQDRFYWGMYKGSYSNARLRSIAGPAVMGSQTRQTEVSRAELNGTGYDTIYKSGWDYICDLLVLIGKSDNLQNVFGNGHDANNAVLATGSTKTYGGFWGRNNHTSDVKVFWIEGFWGNVWEAIRGCVIVSGDIKTKMTPPYNFDGNGYHSTGKRPSGTSGGYVRLASCSDLGGYVPYTADGQATAYFCDALFYSTGGTCYALVGGYWNSSGGISGRALDLVRVTSDTHAARGSRLSYIPQKEA